MSQRTALLGLFLLVLLGVANAQVAQANPPQSATAPDQPQRSSPTNPTEGFVIEQYYTVVRFENDGTSTRDLFVRVRVNSETGGQQFRELVFTYNSGREKFEVRSITVHKTSAAEVFFFNDYAIKDI